MQEIFNQKNQTSFRKFLRNRPTLSEKKLWMHLKSKQLKGHKFRRQFGIGGFVVDFFCPELKLGIELDGDSHGTSEKFEYDALRQKEIEKLGIKILRFTDTDVLENIGSVIESIEKNLP